MKDDIRDCLRLCHVIYSYRKYGICGNYSLYDDYLQIYSQARIYNRRWGVI
ncbi:hypothetical protein BDW75DRAFT_220501 [Aspergillus navahoensis]